MKKGNDCAVNSLQLTLYENQILALLGHNGAGKSRTISMPIGLLPPTSRDALVFGKNIQTDMDEIQKGLGVCIQHESLFLELTVREHLEMFAILKGVKDDLVENVVAEMVDELASRPESPESFQMLVEIAKNPAANAAIPFGAIIDKGDKELKPKPPKKKRN